MTTIEDRLLAMQSQASALLATALIENDAHDIGELADRGLLVGETAAAAHVYGIVTGLLEGIEGVGGSELEPVHRERLNVVTMSEILLTLDAGQDDRFDAIVTRLDPTMSFATRALIRTMARELIAQLELQPGDWRMAAEMAVLDQQIEISAELSLAEEQAESSEPIPDTDAEHAQADDEPEAEP